MEDTDTADFEQANPNSFNIFWEFPNDLQEKVLSEMSSVLKFIPADQTDSNLRDAYVASSYHFAHSVDKKYRHWKDEKCGNSTECNADLRKYVPKISVPESSEVGTYAFYNAETVPLKH